MAIEHVNIPEDGLHEPKGISLAPSSRVYTSTGTGTGSWQEVDRDTLKGLIGNTGPQGDLVITDNEGGVTTRTPKPVTHGMLTMTGNNTAVTVGAASDPTLSTNSDYTEVLLPLSGSNLSNMGASANYLEIQEPGTYHIDFWANVKSSVASTVVALKFVVNGTDFVARRPKKQLPNGGDLDNMSANGLHTFADGDQVKLYIAANKECNITFEDLAYQMVLVGGLA